MSYSIYYVKMIIAMDQSKMRRPMSEGGLEFKNRSFFKAVSFRGSFQQKLEGVCERELSKQLQRRGGVWDEQKK